MPVRCSKQVKAAAFGEGDVKGFVARNKDLYNRRTTSEDAPDEGDVMI